MRLTDNKNFYPTPHNLIYRMCAGLDERKIETILEPSAGKGDIADYLKEKFDRQGRFDMDCIEIDPTLQATLKGKEHRVVHDDFLTYRTQKRYNLIVMNPPFDNGDKHLLKALELQQNGGGVICLLNAETLKNPYTNTRKDLVQKLQDLDAKIEYIENAFMDAERKTGVEVALIKVLIPEREFRSDIFENMQKAMEHEEIEVTEQQKYEIVNADFMEFLKQLVFRYTLEINAGIKLIREYEAMKPLILNSLKEPEQSSHDYRDPIIKLTAGRDKYGENVINNFVKAVRLKYWTYLLKSDSFVGKLTSNLRNDYYNSIDRMQNYEFSIYNILAIEQDMRSRMVKGVEETILKLFDELSHKHSWYDETSKNVHYYSGWKTNKSWKINHKVIIPFYLHERWGSLRSSEARNKFSDITKVFDYLDCGQTKYTDDIGDVLNRYFDQEITKNIPLKYFDVTFYKKNTCHIVFKNKELLEKFNLFGSQRKGWLPPNYGKKAYSDMSTEEQTIVKEFSGTVENYNKIHTNQQYYIVNQLLMLE